MGRAWALAALGLIAAAVVAPSAAAGDFLSALFGGFFGAASRPADALPFVDSRGDLGIERQRRAYGGAAFCVRLCDGRYYPITTGSAPMCSAMCPAARTALLYGGEIEEARADDGTRYEDLPNAYVYRSKLVDGCSCNGKTPFGLAQVDAQADPTLRPGDLVATANALTVFNGRGAFTPIARMRDLKDLRQFAGRASARR